jgi:hypothetical protein
MKRTKSSTVAPALATPAPDGNLLDRVIGSAPAPLLPGENQSDYLKIAGRIANVSRPTDAIEEFLVRDVIDLTWEIFRLRRIKAGILRASTRAGVYTVLDRVGYPDLERSELCDGWAAGDKNARREVSAILTKAGMTIDEVTAETFGHELDSLERIDRMLASAEARRNNALREIDRHRQSLGTAARRSINDIEDADFLDVETGEITAGQS